MFKVLVILTVATVAPAAVKREEYAPTNGANGSSGSATTSNNQPVYSPAASSGSYSTGGSGAFNSNAYPSRDTYAAANSGANQYPADHSSAASSSSASYQSQPSSQGNLYYYYYPVQEKPKEPTYHASSSNQYASAVNPSFASGAPSGQSPAETAPHSNLEPAASGQDLSYSAQDLSYSQQNMGQGIGTEYNSQSGASYDQQLSSLASQLQQYGFGSNPSAYGSSSQGSYSSNNFDSSAPNYGSASSPSASFGSQGEALHSASSHPSYTAAAAASSYGSQNTGSQNPFNAQASGYSPYANGQPSFGNYASASGPQASYEPQTSSSGFRKYGLSSILMPMLALAGLSLLIPTVTSLGSTGRRKRAIDDNMKDNAMNGYIDRIERYYSIYRTAVEKEECMNRIICELGDAMSGVRGKSTVLTVMEKIVPTWMVTKMGVFKNAALSGEYGKCKKYMC